MSIEPGNWVRSDFEVEAIFVTAENIEEVTVWCNGVIESDGAGKKRIKVKVVQPTPTAYSRLRPSKARIGDWVVKDISGWKVYRDPAFMKIFTPKTNPKREVVESLIEECLLSMDGIFYMNDSERQLAWRDTIDKIMEIL